jgi:hypothetical protein
MDSSTPTTVTGITNTVAVAADSSHTCAVLSSWLGYVLGRYDCGEFGNGTTTYRAAPVTLVGFFAFMGNQRRSEYRTFAKSSSVQHGCEPL